MITYTAYAYESIDDAFGVQYHRYEGDARDNVLEAIADMKEMDCGEGCGIVINLGNGESMNLEYKDGVFE